MLRKDVIRSELCSLPRCGGVAKRDRIPPPQPDATFQNETYIGLIFISRRNWQPDELIYTIVMNKILANIAYYGCFVIALIVSYLTLNYAGDLAYSGQQPLVWLSVLAFFAVVTLVVLAITIKAKFKI